MTPHAPIPFPAVDASYQSDRVKWRGVPFEYGDRVLIIPPLPLAAATAPR